MRIVAVLALVGMPLCSASAVTLSTKDEAARDSAMQWLHLIDTGHYEEAATQASVAARTLEQWLKDIKKQRAPFGQMNKRALVDAHHASVFPGVPDVRRYYVLRFKTSFEGKPVAIEHVTLAKVGCCWEIYEYKVSDK